MDIEGLPPGVLQALHSFPGACVEIVLEHSPGPEAWPAADPSLPRVRVGDGARSIEVPVLPGRCYRRLRVPIFGPNGALLGEEYWNLAEETRSSADPGPATGPGPAARGA